MQVFVYSRASPAADADVGRVRGGGLRRRRLLGPVPRSRWHAPRVAVGIGLPDPFLVSSPRLERGSGRGLHLLCALSAATGTVCQQPEGLF